jgi:hypothetical protein
MRPISFRPDMNSRAISQEPRKIDRAAFAGQKWSLVLKKAPGDAGALNWLKSENQYFAMTGPSQRNL